MRDLPPLYFAEMAKQLEKLVRPEWTINTIAVSLEWIVSSTTSLSIVTMACATVIKRPVHQCGSSEGKFAKKICEISIVPKKTIRQSFVASLALTLCVICGVDHYLRCKLLLLWSKASKKY